MDKMINYLEREFELSTIEKLKLKYSIGVLFNDISKCLILLVVFSSITILIVAPIKSKNRPNYSLKKQLHFKFISLAIIIIHFAAYLILNENSYLRNSIWIFTLQSIQLLIKKGVDIYETRKSYF